MRATRGVSRRAAPRPAGTPRVGMIGPGRLVLVVGPSGAGKDTLISGARAAAVGDASLVFPRRVVTRPPSAAEDHATLAAPAFARAAAAGAFALWWQAHGHGYGIPASIDDHIRLGRTVVCNVSRTVVDLARRRYSAVTVAAITAPEDLLRSRLAARQRATDGDIARRLERSAAVEQLFTADVVIRNVARPEAGIRRLLGVIRRGTRGSAARKARAGLDPA